MLRRVNTTRLAVGLSLAVMLGLGMAAAAKAAAPAEKSASTAGRATAALQAAAKHDKYLFIFFFDKEDAQTSAMKDVFQKAMKKMSGRVRL